MTPPPTDAPERGTRRMREPQSWRWLRLAIPFAVAAAVLVFTGVTHAMQTPDVTDPDFLNPESGASLGGHDLAERLRAGGAAVERVTSSTEALARMARGDATLFVPAPGLVDPRNLHAMSELPVNTQVVLVAPDWPTLYNGHIPADQATSRWATGTADPGCRLPEATSAGRAAIVGSRYVGNPDAEVMSCYDGGLLAVVDGSVLVLLAGASDPFRNDRIDEYHNAALATSLLGAHPTLVWLDLHHREKSPKTVPPAPPKRGDYGGIDPNPLWSVFPGWMWAALALLVLVGVLLALASGRRLGPPVSEPLPVAVPAAETVAGRGRLYRRAKARGHALDALRHAALQRLRTDFDLPGDASTSTVVDTVATRTERGAAEVEAILYTYEPDTDEALLRAVEALDMLMHQAEGGAAAHPAAPATPVGRSSTEETR